MPTFVTREAYACSHSRETRQQTLGADKTIMVDAIPISARCLACLCQSLLDTAFPLCSDGSSDNNDYGMIQNRVSSSDMKELSKHLQELLAQKKQRTAASIYCEEDMVESQQRRDLERLVSSVLTPVVAGEFRAALLALSAFPDVDTRFFLPWS
ncbi:hypothetical protein F4677DRAFT_242676 [Hypoxylon crocopeplum]|nr:hypothetical protein F4677DRAFT_242676 [Hypoxylon crocopeplum]